MIHAADREPPVRIEPTADGRRSVRVKTPDGRWVRLHSEYAPEDEARQLIDRALNGRDVPALAAVIGVGMGYVIDDLLRRRPDIRIAAFEILPELDGARHRRDDWAERIASGHLVVAAGPRSELPTVSWPVGVVAETPLVLEHPVLARGWPEARAEAVRVFDQFLYEQRANAEARKRLAGLYLRQTLDNLPVVASSADAGALDGVARESPLVVCGAGPSLDRLLPALAVVRGRAWLVALDTALRPLARAGIVPDLVVSIDPTQVNGRHLIDLPTRARPWLVAEASLDPRAVMAFRWRSFFCRIGRSHPWPWLEEAGIALTRLTAWGSVLTTACDLAARMGSPRVIFAGIDLAFTGGQPYCRGTAFEEDWRAQQLREGRASLDEVWEARIAPDAVTEPDVRGADCRTAPQMIAFRNWVRAFVAASSGPEFVNATGAGILHGPGIVQADLAGALRDAPPRPDVERVLRDAARQKLAHPRVSSAVELIRKDGEVGNRVFTDWADAVPDLDPQAARRALERAASRLRAGDGGKPMNPNGTEWIDVPYDASNFGAKAPLEWQVAESSVVTYAYRVDARTMTLAFKINFSTLAGRPANELHLRIPGNYLPMRGMANTIWYRTPSVKECGYATVHPGLDFVVLLRPTEDVFPIEDGEFFVFGQLTFEVQ